MTKKTVIAAIALTLSFTLLIIAFFLILKSSDSTVTTTTSSTTETITCTVKTKSFKMQGAQKNRNAQITTNCPERLIIANNKNGESSAVEILSGIEAGKTYDFTITAHNPNGVMNIIKATPAK